MLVLEVLSDIYGINKKMNLTGGLANTEDIAFATAYKIDLMWCV